MSGRGKLARATSPDRRSTPSRVARAMVRAIIRAMGLGGAVATDVGSEEHPGGTDNNALIDSFFGAPAIISVRSRYLTVIISAIRLHEILGVISDGYVGNFAPCVGMFARCRPDLRGGSRNIPNGRQPGVSCMGYWFVSGAIISRRTHDTHPRRKRLRADY